MLRYTYMPSAGRKYGIKSTQTGERYKIRQDIDCKSDNIIHLATCKKCGFQGVGSCTKLSQRVFKLHHKY